MTFVLAQEEGCWRAEVDKTREIAQQYRKVIGDTFRSETDENEEAVEYEEQPDGDNKDRLSPGSSLGAIKKRAVSAKSHIFRKGKIESK